ncbi:MAG TPA: amino-acid N-acetyltransferase [Opitutales bacterium]|nr:amino-acid N-acetyltransferase [Opitutales bacterium]
MKSVPASTQMNPTDLRGILQYVPRFRNQIFVIAIDGSVLADENMPNLLLDIAVLRSLHIGVVLIHGIGKQLTDLSVSRGLPISDTHGLGVTDLTTLDLAIEAASAVSHRVMQGLTQSGLKCALTNTIRATPVGIMRGKDQLHTGKVERVDQDAIRHLMSADLIPVVSPIAFDRHGRPFRINSDALATELAIALEATKIIYLCPFAGLEIDGEIQRQIPIEELEKILDRNPETISDNARSKALHAVKAIQAGPPRVHLVDGRIFEGLLAEVFSNEGIGTLIYGNDYQQIRRAGRRDVRTIYNLTRQAVKREEILHRTLQSIERNIGDYYVFEIDENPVACLALQFYPEINSAELASLYVMSAYQDLGIGRKMVSFAELEAKRRGADRLIALSTQTFAFFSLLGFEETDKSVLPSARLATYERSSRNSRVLVKYLKQ